MTGDGVDGGPDGDDAARRSARIRTTAGIAVPALVAGVVAVGLGVPWWIVLLFGLAVGLTIFFGG